MNFIWKHALIENRLCGCGRPSRECPFWGPVFDEEFGGQSEELAREMMRLQYSGARTRHIPLMLTEGGRQKIRGRLGKFLDNTGRLYRAIQAVSGSRVVVDTSKEPAYGYALGMVPGVDLRVLHLIRDPRAAAYSWAKKKRQPDSAEREFMHQKSPTQSAVLWDAWNGAIEALWRNTPENYLRLRYEDFIAEPRQSFEQILELVGRRRSQPTPGRRAGGQARHQPHRKRQPQPLRHGHRGVTPGPRVAERDEAPRQSPRSHLRDPSAALALSLPV